LGFSGYNPTNRRRLALGFLGLRSTGTLCASCAGCGACGIEGRQAVAYFTVFMIEAS